MNGNELKVDAYRRAAGQLGPDADPERPPATDKAGEATIDSGTSKQTSNAENPGRFSPRSRRGPARPAGTNQRADVQPPGGSNRPTGPGQPTGPGRSPGRPHSPDSHDNNAGRGRTRDTAESAEAGPRDALRDVAILLQALGPEDGANVLRRLDPGVAEQIASRALTMESVSADESDRVLAKFGYSRPGRFDVRTVPSPNAAGKAPTATGPDENGAVPGANRSGATEPHSTGRYSGHEYAKEALDRAFGSERADQILRKAVPNIGRVWLGFLEELEAGQLATLLHHESTAVQSLIVAHAAPSVGSRLLSTLGNDTQREIVRRVVRMSGADPEVVRQVADVLKERLRTEGAERSKDVDGVSALAEIMKHLGDEHLLTRLRSDSPDLGRVIEEQIYSIDMIHRIPNRKLAEILNDFDDVDIARILKGKDESVRRRILESMSDNRATIVSEEYRDLGPQLRGDVESITHELVRRLREVAGDELYVD